MKAGVLKTLKGVHLTFTGILSRTRREAQDAARRAGAIIHSGPSAKTTVIVRGRPNPQQAAGRDGGIKLMEIKRLREEGHRITLLNETQFWRLAAARRWRRGRARAAGFLNPCTSAAALAARVRECVGARAGSQQRRFDASQRFADAAHAFAQSPRAPLPHRRGREFPRGSW